MFCILDYCASHYPDTMQMTLERLQKAVGSSSHQHDGWHAHELCDGLANLAQDFENLKYVVRTLALLLPSVISNTGKAVI